MNRYIFFTEYFGNIYILDRKLHKLATYYVNQSLLQALCKYLSLVP